MKHFWWTFPLLLWLSWAGGCAGKATREPGMTEPSVTDANKTTNPNAVIDPNTGAGNSNNNTGNSNYVVIQPALPDPPDFGPPPPPIPSFTPSPFLRVALGPAGASFSINGVPYRVLGYEASLADTGNYCDWTGPQLEQALDAMASQGNVNTVRMWFYQATGGPPGPDNHHGWTAFDQAIAAAKARSLRIIPTLVNQWGDCEPPLQGSARSRKYKTVDWYVSGYREASDGYPLAYRDYVRAVAERYAGEPTIAFWQLVNEAEAAETRYGSCHDASAAAAAIRTFADDMVDVIHSVDSNHLINLGTRDNGVCGPEDANSNYLHIHDGKIDICEVHSYDPVLPALPSLIKTKIEACKTLGKPIFMGEVGFCRVPDPNDASGVTCIAPPDPRVTDPNVLKVTLEDRARHFDVRLQAGFDAGLSGVVLWQWSPFVDSANNAGDPYHGIGVGDPTIDVLRKY